MMKNKFLFLVMFLGVALFSACNDDDDDRPKDFNGAYSESNADYVLDLRYSNSVLAGKTVEFNTDDNVNATLKLQGVIPGEKETVISGIKLVSDKSVYTFSAEDKNDTRTVLLDGTIQKGKLNLAVGVKFAENDLMGVWDLGKTPLFVIWEPAHLDLGEMEMGGKTITFNTGFIKTIAPTVGNMLKGYLQSVTFQEDGNIIATYNAAAATEENPSPTADWRTSPKNLVHYYVKDGVCYVSPNVEMIMRQVEIDNAGRSTGSNPLTTIIDQLLGAGIPVHFEFTKGTEATSDAVKVYLDEVYIKQLSPLIPLVKGLVADDMAFKTKVPILGEISIPVKPILDNLPSVLEQTTKLQVGLNLVGAE